METGAKGPKTNLIFYIFNYIEVVFITPFMRVALCFLISNPEGRLHQSEVWRSYFSHPSARHHGAVYVHSKHPVTDPFLLEFATILENPIVNTSWGHISIVEATLHLLRSALEDLSNMYFMLLSESCIPIVDFECLWTFLKEQTVPRSIFNGGKCPWDFYYRYHDVSPLPDGSPYIGWDRFMVQSQWMLLCRDDAQLLDETRNDTQYFRHMPIPDEHYFINVLHRNGRAFDYRPLVYMEWRSGQKHPNTFSTITPDLVRTAVSTGAFFLRKVNDSTQIL